MVYDILTDTTPDKLLSALCISFLALSINLVIFTACKYKRASILLTRENFGCGSSREHAPWALEEYGFKVIIASSFADIFYGNCINIGLLPIKLSENEIEQLFALANGTKLTLTVDLPSNKISFTNANGEQVSFSFSLNKFQQYSLESGVDSVGWTLTKLKKIEAFEANLPAWQ